MRFPLPSDVARRTASPRTASPRRDRLSIAPLKELLLLVALISPASGQVCEQEIVLVPGQAASDSFGASVALSGDFAFVGDPELNLTVGPGHVSAYTRHPVGGHLLFDLQLTASDGLNEDRFGVDCDVDGSTLVVGADGHDASGADAGAAYVFERIQGQWIETQKLQSPSAAIGDQFGASVAVDGEWMLVSAPGRGQVFVYRALAGSWILFQEVFLPNSQAVGSVASVIDTDTFAVSNLNRAEIFEWDSAAQRWERTFGTATGSAFRFSGMSLLADRFVLARNYGLIEVYERNGSTGSWGPGGALDVASPGAVAQTSDRVLVMAPSNSVVRTFQRRATHWAASDSVPGGMAGSRTLASQGSSVLVSGPVTPTLYDFDCGAVGTVECRQTATNSTGSTGALQALGSRSAAVNQLALWATVLPENAFGFFLASQAPGFAMTPGTAVGNLCLGGAVGRYVGPGEILNSGGAGGFLLSLNLTTMPTPTGPVSATAGQTWYFQAWHRDANPQPESNFTHSISVLLE